MKGKEGLWHYWLEQTGSNLRQPATPDFLQNTEILEKSGVVFGFNLMALEKPNAIPFFF